MIVKARDAARAYLNEKMLPRWTENEIWGRHYWDWEAAVMTGGVSWVCEYFLDHPETFPNWKIDVRNILSLIFSRNGVDPVSKGDLYSGAWAFPESSSCCGTSLSYNQYTYGPAFLRYGVLADDERMREIGRRMMIMAAYDSTATGYVLDGLDGNGLIVLFLHGSLITRKPSLPLGSMTLTAIRPYLPLGKGRLRRPLSASKADSSITPFCPRALASFAHFVLSGKKAWQMQNVRPS